MSEIRFSLIGEISDHNLRAAIRELEIACEVSSDQIDTSPIIHFLMLCVYPGPEPGKRVPISTECMASAPLLDCKVGKLPDGDLRDLCAELAVANRAAPINRRNIDFYNGSKLAAFFNKTIPKQDRPNKPTANQARRERIVMRRRENRR